MASPNRAHPSNPSWEPTEGPGSGDDRYRFRPATEQARHLRLVVDNTKDKP